MPNWGEISHVELRRTGGLVGRYEVADSTYLRINKIKGLYGKILPILGLVFMRVTACQRVHPVPYY